VLIVQSIRKKLFEITKIKKIRRDIQLEFHKFLYKNYFFQYDKKKNQNKRRNELRLSFEPMIF
jgi:hypothetical protein